MDIISEYLHLWATKTLNLNKGINKKIESKLLKKIQN